MTKNRSDYEKKFAQKYSNKKKYPTKICLEDRKFRLEKILETEKKSSSIGEWTLLVSMILLGTTILFNFVNIKFTVGAYEETSRVVADFTGIASGGLFILILILFFMLFRYSTFIIEHKFLLPTAGKIEIEINAVNDELFKRKKNEEAQKMERELISDIKKIYLIDKEIRENERSIKKIEDADSDFDNLVSIVIASFISFILAIILEIFNVSILYKVGICLIIYMLGLIILINLKIFVIDNNFILKKDRARIQELVDKNEELYKEKFDLEKQK